MNCSGGGTMSLAPEVWNPTWENNLAAAQMADEAGIDFLLPVARWTGYGGRCDAQGISFESLSWASAILASTRNIRVFSTVHVPLIHPVFAAKQAVTADHVGRGRWGLNIVSGWNEAEFRMFGAPLLEHDERYNYSEEWLTILRRLWAADEPFDYHGKHFDLVGVFGRPKPFGDTQPMIMSAGSSGAGRAFAAKNVDCLFMIVVKLDTLAREVSELRADAGRPVGVFSSGHIICRQTEREADEFYHYLVHEKGDWAAAENATVIRAQSHSMPNGVMRQLKERVISGSGTYLIKGSPDQVANQIKELSDAGVDGAAFAMPNYLTDLPLIRDEVLPRLERLGIRSPASYPAILERA
jgi:alkanesulfonate monooxygenase SsuD/methylene tetrahydromethanopterin reductase-like flavin-dependent oxidoreductase (luciferase family)